VKTRIIPLVILVLSIFPVSCPVGNLSGYTVEVVVSPDTVTAGNNATATVTVTVRDPDGDPVSGRSLSISCSGNANRFSPDETQNSDVNGQAVWTLRSFIEEAKTITASVTGTSCANTATITFSGRGTGITQPSGTTIPRPLGCGAGNPTGLAAVFASQCVDPGASNIGIPCVSDGNCDDGINSTCETTLWHTYNDNICIPSNIAGLDPWVSAAITPETFFPVGPLTFTVASRGSTIFANAFGWYNATGSVPAISDLHVVSGCNETGGSGVTVDVQNEAAYLGGRIGFFLVTPESHTVHGSYADGNPCASVGRFAGGVGYVYYSERTLNPDAAGPNSFIHLLVYESRVWEHKFYFAWEDRFGDGDNDFIDLVVSVAGINF
jgi:hypothetical protein